MSGPERKQNLRKIHLWVKKRDLIVNLDPTVVNKLPVGQVELMFIVTLLLILEAVESGPMYQAAKFVHKIP